MLTISKTLTYYKREDIRKALVEGAKDKEIAIKFGDKGYGKRPDILLALLKYGFNHKNNLKKEKVYS